MQSHLSERASGVTVYLWALCSDCWGVMTSDSPKSLYSIVCHQFPVYTSKTWSLIHLGPHEAIIFSLHLRYLHLLVWKVQLWEAGDLITTVPSVWSTKSALNMAEESMKTLCNTYIWNRHRMDMADQTPWGDILFNEKPLTPEFCPTSSLTHRPSPMTINSTCFLLHIIIWLALKFAFALKKAHVVFWLGQNLPSFQDPLP